jgi:hypothetical protein
MEGIDLVQSATPNIVGVNQYAMGKFTIEQGSRRLASSASHDGSLESKKKCTLEPNKKSTNIELCSAAVDPNQNQKNKSPPLLLTAWDLDYQFDAFALLTLITLASEELKWLIIEAARFLGVGVNAR